MAKLTVRDPYGNTFEIDAYARPYWERREGHQILPAPGDEPSPQEPAEPIPPAKKAASRPASNVKEQVNG